MAETDKFVIVLRVRTESACRYCHAVFKIPVKARLWAVIFCKIVEELLRRRGEPEFLGHAGKAVPDFEYLLF